MKNLHFKIKGMRKAKGLTQESVAEALGMTKGNLSRMEKGDVGVSPERLELMAGLFGVSVDELLAFEPVEERVTAELRQDTLSEKVRAQEALIKRMRRDTERFLLTVLTRYINEDEQAKKEGRKITLHADDRLWELPGVAHLLNGENTSPDFFLLEPFNEYHNHKALALVLGQLRTELGEEDD